MGWVWDLLTIVAITIWVLPLLAQGHLEARHAGLVLAVLVGVVALGRGLGREVYRRVRWLFRVLFPITAIVIFGMVYGQGEWRQVTGILGAVAILIVMLFGFYMMVSGPFRR